MHQPTGTVGLGMQQVVTYSRLLTSTVKPWRARNMAATAPAGPAPTTTAFLPVYKGVTAGAGSAASGACAGARLKDTSPAFVLAKRGRPFTVLSLHSRQPVSASRLL